MHWSNFWTFLLGNLVQWCDMAVALYGPIMGVWVPMNLVLESIGDPQELGRPSTPLTQQIKYGHYVCRYSVVWKKFKISVPQYNVTESWSHAWQMMYHRANWELGQEFCQMKMSMLFIDGSFLTGLGFAICNGWFLWIIDSLVTMFEF